MPRQPTKGATSAGKKRSLARRFNASLTAQAAKTPTAKTLDQRTVRRLDRYRSELKNGKSPRGKGLTPLDIAMRVNELLANGAKLAELKKLIKPRTVEFDHETLVAILVEMHPIYGYRPVAYRFAGVPDDALLAAGIIDKMPARRGPKPATKKVALAKKK
jgi:hypothetical protein